MQGRSEALDLVLVGVHVDSTGGEGAEQLVPQLIHRKAGSTDGDWVAGRGRLFNCSQIWREVKIHPKMHLETRLPNKVPYSTCCMTHVPL